MDSQLDLIRMSPQSFVDFCKDQGIQRFFLVYDPQQDLVRASHPQLEPWAEFVGSDSRDFMQHEGLFFHITP